MIKITLDHVKNVYDSIDSYHFCNTGESGGTHKRFNLN
jgi:hypothetical protein